LRKARVRLDALLRDQAGNALMITAATIMLLVSLAGSGTDIARAYMTRTSLQNACDAGVLAGRKAMSKSGTYGTTEKARASKMFNFNFNPLATDANTIVFSSSANTSGQVLATATAKMPMTIMRIFGFKDTSLSVACSAELQMASADVMFVLDTTGSMKYDPDGVGCCNLGTSKIAGLRSAVGDFYKTVAAAVTDKTNTRIRFGFVPYSSTVNVKELVTTGALPTSYLAGTADYQTILAYFNTPSYTANTPTAANPVTETYSTPLKSSDCTNWGKNGYPTSGPNPVVVTPAPPGTKTSTQYAWLSWSGSGNGMGTCKRTATVTSTTYKTVYNFTNWRFIKASADVSTFKGLTSVPLLSSIASGATVPTAGYYDRRALAAMVGQTDVSGIGTANYTWNGCIEERATVQSLSMSPVPSGATDLDLDSAPSSTATSWKMYLEGMEFWRSNNATSYDSTVIPNGYGQQTSYCPASMKQFTTVDTTDPTTVPSWLTTYLNTLAAEGATYHDIGMIWGGRLGSPTGIFTSNVNADSTKYPSVSRHIIFMTDGVMEPTQSIYNAYGTEYYDHRVAPSGVTDGASGTLKDYHNARFLAVCDKVKQMGYTVWVIGFGQSLTTQMQSCATAGRAYFASNTTDLKNTFKFIAGQVADLRINK
jgi:Flp pilus assembly protein TadG